MASVTITGVTKSFGNVKVLQEFNQKFEDGEFITLLGPSGCGKTTMLRLIAGFEKPSSGEIYIGDKLVSSEKEFLPPEKRGIGMVFQSYAVWPHMNVFDNIAYPLKIQKINKNEIEERVNQVLKIVHLEQYKDRFPSELSGGQQQRVALGRALVAQPEILLLDEPLSNLDAKLRVDLRKELKRLQKDLGITTLYVTHDQEEALTLSDRIAVFNNGFIEQVGTPPEIYHQSKTEFVCDFIGDINVLTEETVHDILSKNPSVNLEDKKGYIRLEKIRFKRETEEDILLNGTIIDTEFSVVNVRYTIQVSEKQIVNVTRIDSQFAIKSVGENVELYITPSDIVQY